MSCNSLDSNFSFTIERYKGEAGLEQIKSDWDQLYKNCEDTAYYNDWRWHYLVNRHLCQDSLLYFRVLAQQASVAIIPIQAIRHKLGPLTICGFQLPQHNHIDLSDVLLHKEYDGKLIIQKFLQYIKENKPYRFHYLTFDKVRGQSNLGKWIQTFPGSAWTDDVCTFFPCEDQKNYLSHLSKKLIKNIKRLQRKAEYNGKFKFIRFTGLEAKEHAFHQFLELERSGWKGAEGTQTSIALDDSIQNFYLEMIQIFGNEAFINFLKQGDHFVASQLGLDIMGKVYLLKIGYNVQFKSWSPGNILLAQLLDHVANSSESNEVNLVTGPEWADRWHPSRDPIFSWIYFNSNLIGLLLKLAFNTQRKIKLSIKFIFNTKK